ncbi:hypothetical protein AMTRI_Chr13g82940 [Amborella trichopoda]|uniref:t-SNARE coiled-coil homology domain-containing protein n=1 Tax=Amborella trichopoda TaxID=13333 RepID=W1NZY4_AMBTC|nr:syntaxin-124 [Amborella trichopoda]ERN00250.1 hypothetical protein AMTR_s00111p00136390 [Amborella trichopoda]|eukprot:XP_006837396.1 syntaxin-124 [Amborella trichopoda]
MNDLFSGSFKKYTDLKKQVVYDMEGGIGERVEGEAVRKETINLDHFFEDVENVKEDLHVLERLYQQLQDANEESRTVHNAKTMKELRARMDKDVEQVLKKAKVVKGKLEALDRSNVAHRNLPGCGPGTSADRTRTSVVSGLGKKLKDLMDGFQSLRTRIGAEYRETVERRYYTVTGELPDEGTMDRLISTGESETFMQKAIQQQGRGHVLDTISEIQERHDAVKDIERNLLDLHQVFLDMAVLVEAQGQQLNDIESHVAHANSFVRRGTDQLQTGKELQKSTRSWTCYATVLLLVIFALILVPVLRSLR